VRANGTIEPSWPGDPHPGSAEGLIEIPDDFDAPEDDSVQPASLGNGEAPSS
jgi:hypothetical protein